MTPARSSLNPVGHSTTDSEHPTFDSWPVADRRAFGVGCWVLEVFHRLAAASGVANWKLTLPALLALALFTAGCLSNSGGSPRDGRVAGRWVSVEDSLNGAHAPDAAIAAAFNRDGRFAWRDGGGTKSGTYRLEAGRLTLVDANTGETSALACRFYKDYLIVEDKDRLTITFREADPTTVHAELPLKVAKAAPVPASVEPAPADVASTKPRETQPAPAPVQPSKSEPAPAKVAKAKPALPPVKREAPSNAPRTDAAQAKAECRKHLETIYSAIQAYRKEHKDTPNWLSDLVPKYLPDARVLLCPTGRPAGELLFGLDDPKLPTSYVYEFCNRPVPPIIRGGSSITMKQWRQDTMALVGGGTPIVRCHLHDHVLNISFDGEFYESGTDWDRLPRFSDKIDRSKLAPRR